MRLYVVYWVDLDDDCLKKSIVEILGVYDSEAKAEEVREAFEYKKGYTDDDRCSYCRVEVLELNEHTTLAKEQLDKDKCDCEADRTSEWAERCPYHRKLDMFSGILHDLRFR